MATYETAPVFTLMEIEILDTMKKLVGFPNGDGLFLPGGSTANMYAIHLARYKKNPGFNQKGLW